jgi:hypothetical protein
MAETNQLSYSINIGGNAVESIGSVKKALKEANAELINAQANFGDYSQEAINAAKKVAELKDRISEARETADLFDPGQKFKAFAGAINAVAGGFTALQGALGVVGAESEDLQKSLLKVQSALALSQGLSTITDSAKDFQRLATIIKTNVVTAFSTLRGAIIATGVGALAIGLTLVIANFDKVKKAILDTFPGLGKFASFVGNIITKVTDFVGVTSQAERALAALEKTTKRGNEGIEARIKVLTAQGGKEKEIYELSKQQGENELAFLRAKLKTKEGLNAEELKKFRDLKTEQAVLDAQENKRKEDLAKEAGEKAKGISDKLAEEEANRIQKRIDDEKKLTEELLAEYDKRRNIANNAKILSQKELNALDEEDRIKKQEEENKKFDTQIATLGKTKNFTLELIRNNQETNAKIKADNDAARQAELTARMAFAASVAMAIGELNGLFEQGTAASKIAGLAQIAINTGVGFAQGLSIAQQSAKATGPAAAFAFPIFYATQVAAVLAAAGKAKSILSQVKGGGAGGSVTAPSIQQQAPISPAQPQAQTTSLNSATINALGNQATRAYVIESDVTSSQQRIAAIQQRARFG